MLEKPTRAQLRDPIRLHGFICKIIDELEDLRSLAAGLEKERDKRVAAAERRRLKEEKARADAEAKAIAVAEAKALLAAEEAAKEAEAAAKKKAEAEAKERDRKLADARKLIKETE